MGRRGQATTEYLLLLCSVLTMTVMTASFIGRYGNELVDRVGERVLEAAIVLALP